jgi:periplasmic protein TonB
MIHRVSKNTTLEEMVFSGRNKEYGSYILRRNSNRYLIFSALISVSFCLTVLGVIFLSYYFEKPAMMMMDMTYLADYNPIEPIDARELQEMMNSLPKPPAAPDLAPVVTDSVKPENEKPTDIVPEKKEEEKPADSAGQGGNGFNKGTGQGSEDGIYTVIDVYPRFPGGDVTRLYFLRTNIHYPEAAVKGKIQGTIILTFIIEVDGSVSHVEVLKGIGGGCDEEAVRVTKMMPRWEPGKRSGKAVRVMVKMPIVFRVPGK